MPLISIIVPVYNVEKYLRDCLDSIINQTYKELDIILVDDGSTDHSGEICDSYARKDNRIRVLHTNNQGVSCARNAGIECANGDAVCFIDSDDTVDNDYIYKLVNVWIKHNYDLVICNIRDVFENRTNIKRNIEEPLSGDFKKDYHILVELLRGPVVKLYKMEIIKKHSIKFPVSFHISEDQLWNFEYYKYIKSYFYIDESLYSYFHRNNDSLSSLRDYKSYLADLAKLKFEKDFLTKNKIKNANAVLTNHALWALKKYVFLSDERNTYSNFMKRWNELEVLIDIKTMPKSVKKRMLFWLIKRNLHCVVYLYYLLTVVNGVRGRTLLKKCTSLRRGV